MRNVGRRTATIPQWTPSTNGTVLFCSAVVQGMIRTEMSSENAHNRNVDTPAQVWIEPLVSYVRLINFCCQSGKTLSTTWVILATQGTVHRWVERFRTGTGPLGLEAANGVLHRWHQGTRGPKKHMYGEPGRLLRKMTAFVLLYLLLDIGTRKN